jgi:hypothetical protein
MIILSFATLSAFRSDVCLYGMEDKLEVTVRRSEQDISSSGTCSEYTAVTVLLFITSVRSDPHGHVTELTYAIRSAVCIELTHVQHIRAHLLRS